MAIVPQAFRFLLFGLILFGCSKALDVPGPAKSTHLSPCYISTKISGQDNVERLLVYVRVDESTMFVGFTIGHEVDTSAQVYSNQYRLQNASLYNYNGHEMSKVVANILQNGESECVYKVTGRDDFTGGFHGDEQLQTIHFYADEQVLGTSEDLYLLPCSTFYYMQESTTHESVVNGNHPVEARHRKQTIFHNNGYESINRLEWTRTVQVYLWYHGIVSIGKSAGTLFAFHPDSTFYQSNSDNSFIPAPRSGMHDVWYQNTSTQIGVHVASALILPENSDKTASLKIWDTPVYSKYYRTYYPAAAVDSGTIWESHTTVMYSY